MDRQLKSKPQNLAHQKPRKFQKKLHEIPISGNASESSFPAEFHAKLTHLFFKPWIFGCSLVTDP
jgi:hypothetical protein